jgi:hypothetical protein
MRSTSSWFLVRGLTLVSLLALPACVVEGTTSASATTPAEAAGTTAPTPTVPATPKPPPPVVVIPPPPPATAVPTAPTTVPSTPPATGSTSLIGKWESPSCGDRTYPRHITFADATTFSAEDLVSPCPKGTACIWSGILINQGIYKVERDVVTLKVEKPSSGPKKAQLPTTLTLNASRALVEAGSDGKPCPYRQTATDKRP